MVVQVPVVSNTAKVDDHHCNVCDVAPMNVSCLKKGHGYKCEVCDHACSAKHGCAIHQNKYGYNALANQFVKGEKIDTKGYELAKELARQEAQIAESEAELKRTEEEKEIAKLRRIESAKKPGCSGFWANGAIDWISLWDKFPTEAQEISEMKELPDQESAIRLLFPPARIIAAEASSDTFTDSNVLGRIRSEDSTIHTSSTKKHKGWHRRRSESNLNEPVKQKKKRRGDSLAAVIDTPEKKE